MFNKPQVFDHASQEQDQRHYRNWLWQLTQYLICVDEGFSKELSQITDAPPKQLAMSSAPSDVRQRSAKLYGLLAGLVKNRALAIVRAAPPGDGFEALRQMTLSMRPNTQARRLALLSTVTAWPGFTMSKPLQAQLLRLEDAFEETRRAGSNLGDEVKTAILLRCITGALKMHLTLNLKEISSYGEVREEVLRWDRGHQKWLNVVQPHDGGGAGTSGNSDVMPMEIDRVKAKNGKSGKGKTDKGQQNGKAKGKGKEKGKNKFSFDKGGKYGKGKMQNQGKGKGGKAEKSCFVCGQVGHYAKDCWQAVRNVQAPRSQAGSSSTD